MIGEKRHKIWGMDTIFLPMHISGEFRISSEKLYIHDTKKERKKIVTVSKLKKTTSPKPLFSSIGL